MKTKSLTIVALLACAAGISTAAALTRNTSDAKITGDYVEARTASVFAGACHYNGEVVSTGRDAVMAWNFTGGSFKGVSLDGVRAAAAVTSSASLGDEAGARTTELTIDSSASNAQVKAVQELIQSKLGAQLGTIVSVRRDPIRFAHTSNGYVVDAAGFASMNVEYMPDDSCCKQANFVWYNPLTPLHQRKVGFTEEASFTGKIADRWSRYGENSAFYGTFTF